jgi:hypothetical protein
MFGVSIFSLGLSVICYLVFLLPLFSEKRAGQEQKQRPVGVGKGMVGSQSQGG